MDSQSLRCGRQGGRGWGRRRLRFEDSVGYGAGRPEVREELEPEADHKVPDVSGHLGASDEDPPDEDDQQGVEGVADVPQSGKEGGDKKVDLLLLEFPLNITASTPKPKKKKTIFTVSRESITRTLSSSF